MTILGSIMMAITVIERLAVYKHENRQADIEDMFMYSKVVTASF